MSDDEDDSGTSLSEDDIQQLLSHAPENKPKGGYLNADPDPTDEDCSGLAVRLDVAVLAVRLTAWKVVTRVYPKKRRSILTQIKQSFENFVAKTVVTGIAKTFIKELAKQVASLFTSILQFVNAVRNAREAEELIRGACHTIRQQLLQQALSKKRTRSRRIVSTRHVTG